MKKLLCAVMASATALTSIVISVPAAATVSSYEGLEYQINGSEITITDYTGSDSYVYIPDTIDGRKVVEIESNAFSGNETIEHIRFSAYLRRINEKAFQSCSALQEVVLPASLTFIDSCAFEYCYNISDVVFGNDVKLGYAVFENCHNIENVTLYPGNSVTYEGYDDVTYSFVNCENISNVYYFGNSAYEKEHFSHNFTRLFVNQTGIYNVFIMDSVNYYALKSVAENISVFNPKSTHSIVSFDPNGGSGDSKLYALKGQMVSEPVPPEKEDCDFLGWYKNPECTGEPWDFVFDKVYEDTTLYAKWCPKQYTLTFDSTGGTSAESIDVSFGTAIGDMPTPTKSGYQFAGWYTREKGNGELYTPDNIMPKSDIKLYASWLQNGKSLVVDFDTNGGKGSVEKCLVGYNETIDSFPTVKRTGYTFVEWNSKPDGTGAHVTEKTKIIYNNLKLYAVWKPNPCTVTLNAKKGTVTKNKLTVNYGSKIGTLETPEREAYEFLGWYYADGTECFPDDIITNNVKLTAKWRGYEYMILLNPKGGKMSEEDTRYVCCGDSVGELPVPTRKGYYFLGWFTKSRAKGTQYNAETEMPEKDITLYAGWKKKSGYATSVSLDVKSLSLGVGQSQSLTATLTPIATLDTLSWTSSNTKVAAVSSTGTVTAKGAGTATITVKTTKGKTASVKIKVKKAVTKLTASYNSRTIKADQTVKATVKANGYAGTLKWTSSNPSVVTVDQKGNITGVKKGKATVTIKAYNGITTKITIIVK